LIHAIIGRKTNLVNILLEKDSSKIINLADNEGNTPLMNAVGIQDLEMVKLLIEQGADLHLKNDERQTALDIASMIGNQDILSCLQEALSHDLAQQSPQVPDKRKELLAHSFNIAKAEKIHTITPLADRTQNILEETVNKSTPKAKK
jgi:ankyrin repeat protein